MERLSIKDLWKKIVALNEWETMRANKFSLETLYIAIHLFRGPSSLTLAGSLNTEQGLVPFTIMCMTRDETYDTSNWHLVRCELPLEEFERELAVAIKKSGIVINNMGNSKQFYLANIELKRYDEPGWESCQNVVMANSAQEVIEMLKFYYFWYNDIEVIPFLLPTGLTSELCGI